MSILKDKGFTLMELIVVISLIGILAVTSLYSFSTWKTTSQVSVAAEAFYKVYTVMTISCSLTPSTGNTESVIANRLEPGTTLVSQALPKLNGASYSFTAPVDCTTSSIKASKLTTPTLADGTQRVCTGTSADADPATPCI